MNTVFLSILARLLEFLPDAAYPARSSNGSSGVSRSGSEIEEPSHGKHNG
jgi:hypothetical protein